MRDPDSLLVDPKGQPIPSATAWWRRQLTRSREAIIWTAGGIAFLATVLGNLGSLTDQIQRWLGDNRDQISVRVTHIPPRLPALREQLRTEFQVDDGDTVTADRAPGLSRAREDRAMGSGGPRGSAQRASISPPASRWTMAYLVKETRDQISISPRAPIYEIYERDHVAPINPGWLVHETVWPTIDLLITNNALRTVTLERVVLDVESSAMDGRTMFVTLPGNGTLTFFDEGWGRVTDFHVRLRLSPAMTDSASLDLEWKIPHVGDGVSIELEKLLAYLGWRGAVFSGELAYMEAYGGKTQARSVRFGPERFSSFRVAGGGGGSFHSPDLSYDVLLSVDSSSYEREVRLASVLRTGESTRIQFVMGALSSSSHEFRVISYFSDGSQVISPPISLHVLVPRSGLAAYLFLKEEQRSSGGFSFGNVFVFSRAIVPGFENR